jgi:preprotein translocase subunit SecF
LDLPYATSWDLVARRRWWYLLSLLVVVPGTIAWVTHGLNKGIDFTGGVLMKFEADTAFVQPGQDIAAITKARNILHAQGVTKEKVQLSEGRTFLIRAQVATAERVEPAAKDPTLALMDQIGAGLSRQFGVSFRPTRELVEPIIGKELALNAVKALVLGCGLILIFISWRYEFRFAVAAVIALLHDCLVLVGIFALTRLEIDSSFVAALLTIVGYSINDTVVIFDRIRENLRLHRREPFPHVVNASLWQTMARSINTVATTLFTLIALFFLGGPTIHNFALALIVGITSGCYSSIFNASQILVSWKEWDRRRSERREQGRREAFMRPRPRPLPKPAVPSAGETGRDSSEPGGTTGDLEAPRPAEPSREPKRAPRRGPRTRTRRRRY